MNYQEAMSVINHGYNVIPMVELYSDGNSIGWADSTYYIAKVCYYPNEDETWKYVANKEETSKSTKFIVLIVHDIIRNPILNTTYNKFSVPIIPDEMLLTFTDYHKAYEHLDGLALKVKKELVNEKIQNMEKDFV